MRDAVVIMSFSSANALVESALLIEHDDSTVQATEECIATVVDYSLASYSQGLVNFSLIVTCNGWIVGRRTGYCDSYNYIPIERRSQPQ